MTAKAALAAAEAAGLRFTLATDGRVVMTAAAEPPRDVVQALRQHKADVAKLLAMRLAPLPAPSPAEWRDMPFGPRRGAAFRSARMATGACSCCAGGVAQMKPGRNIGAARYATHRRRGWKVLSASSRRKNELKIQ